MRERLARIAQVSAFDYAYQTQGRRLPDRLPKLIATHLEAFAAARRANAERLNWVFAGKSMGGRVGCHASLELEGTSPAALICFGYPLIGQNGARREDVLLRLERPVLFVQGGRDAMCPLEDLERVRERLQVPSALHVVPDGDHSLEVTARDLARLGTSQAELDAGVDDAIFQFVQRHVMSRVDTPAG